MRNLTGKNVALIVPKYFNYEASIQSELEMRGAVVFRIYENVEEVNYLYRIVYRYFPSKRDKLMDKYYKKYINSLPEKIDLIFVIRGSSVTEETMRLFHKKYPQSHFIMYQWDSVNNNPRAYEIAKYFDHVYTFDNIDATTLGWIYRPLFYTSEDTNVPKDIDISYVCSIHSERIQILNKLKSLCSNKKFKLYTYVYSNKLIYYKRKYLAKVPEYQMAEDSDIKFKPLRTDDTIRIYQRSNIVVDYTNPNQTGFTMRTIECLGNRCKLVTNNNDVKNADFFNDQNIYVYDGLNLNIPDSFITSPYVSLSNELYKYYSLSGWLDFLLETI